MLEFINLTEITRSENNAELERNRYINAFEIFDFAPINENDLSRGIEIEFKNGNIREYKCDIIDFMKLLQQAKIKAYATLINESNGNNNNRKRKPKSTSRAKFSK
jgi:hypothetical protein